MVPIAAVEFDKLLDVIVVSLVAGVGVTAFFSLVIYGSVRAAEARRTGHGDLATVYGALASIAFLVVAGGVVFAIKVILDKG